MNTPETTTSGNVHGMPLAALLGPEPAELSAIAGVSPTVEPSRTVVLGARNLDPGERRRTLDSGIHVFTMNDIDRNGLAVVAAAAIDLASSGALGIHVSFDLDACDPTIAPGVGTAVKGGLSYRETHMLMDLVAESGKMLSLDLVEVNPILDIQSTTAQLAVELALSGLGQTIL
jgi:arginase